MGVDFRCGKSFVNYLGWDAMCAFRRSHLGRHAVRSARSVSAASEQSLGFWLVSVLVSVISPSSRRSGPFDERDDEAVPLLSPLPPLTHSRFRSFCDCSCTEGQTFIRLSLVGAEDRPEHRRPTEPLSRVAQGSVELRQFRFCPSDGDIQRSTCRSSLRKPEANGDGVERSSRPTPCPAGWLLSRSQTGRHSD